MSLFFSVLPLLLILAVGYGLAKSEIIPRAGWSAIETLSFLRRTLGEPSPAAPRLARRMR